MPAMRTSRVSEPGVGMRKVDITRRWKTSASSSAVIDP